MNASPLIGAQRGTEPSHGAVAPAWHTAVVLCILLGLSLAGALLPLGGASRRVPEYIFVMTFEWVLVGFIWHGVSRRGIRMSDLVGGRWARPVDFLRDLGIAVGFLLVGGGALEGLGYLLKVTDNPTLRSLLPQSCTEVVLWVLMSLTAGFCEEVIFRGYLRRQFAALTRATAGGIVLQGIAFGAAHGYQGWKYMLLIAVYGIMFGLLAQWRRSLRPGMITHFAQDAAGGLLARYL